MNQDQTKPTPIWAWCLIFFVTGFCVALVEIVAC